MLQTLSSAEKDWIDCYRAMTREERAAARAFLVEGDTGAFESFGERGERLKCVTMAVLADRHNEFSFLVR